MTMHLTSSWTATTGVGFVLAAVVLLVVGLVVGRITKWTALLPAELVLAVDALTS